MNTEKSHWNTKNSIYIASCLEKSSTLNIVLLGTQLKFTHPGQIRSLFSTQVNYLLVQSYSILEYIVDHHRDLLPSNFLTGLQNPLLCLVIVSVCF